ncbi:uncharacterized protein BXZ73DRAFT_39335 [Epithele typhae]|uniref:uncharacterized protein n=1 Tax=Epithele typhae TaxID=378194 RepID=UPI0020084667|nr:uncharacterized protein BXZ73DRAFT_39335 [Epithele typhae]KAH9944547.1 hypothetical protein BXZ73DRAFT_39335 [Epithele typhae]
MRHAGRVLDAALPYESRPNSSRRTTFLSPGGAGAGTEDADRALAVVAHAVHDSTGMHRVTYSSAFALNVPGTPEGQAVYLTCAHTLEEIRHDPVLRTTPIQSASAPSSSLLSGSFVISGSSAAPTFHPVAAVLSAMHRGDLVLLAAPAPARACSLPVNPYPVRPGTRVCAHFVTDRPPAEGQDAEGWTPWVGGAWRKWVRGTVLGYRDYAGREAQPGTYDSLAHLHFEPPPTAGSSGGPIVDEESGSVIGVVLGTQLVSQVEGVRGWAAPAEMIYEMFSLPGLEPKH